MVLTLAMSLVGGANAYDVVQNSYGEMISWPSMPETYELDTEGAPANVDAVASIRAIDAAFAAWSEIPGADVALNPSTPSVRPEDLNKVFWESDWRWDPAILAMTSTWSNEFGQITGFEIAINARDPHWVVEDRDGMDLQNAMTHEVGHAIGLDHTDELAATMYPTAGTGERSKRDLHWDDEDGARFMYPASAEGSALLETLGCNIASTAPAALTVFLPVVVLITRRRRS